MGITPKRKVIKGLPKHSSEDAAIIRELSHRKTIAREVANLLLPESGTARYGRLPEYLIRLAMGLITVTPVLTSTTAKPATPPDPAEIAQKLLQTLIYSAHALTIKTLVDIRKLAKDLRISLDPINIRALSQTQRILLQRLHSRPFSVKELALKVRLCQSAVYKHLRVLRKKGIIYLTATKEYKITDAAKNALIREDASSKEKTPAPKP